jgi:hypothetical protein
MSNFQTLLAQHIAKELDVSEKKVLKALDSFSVSNDADTTADTKKNKRFIVTEPKPTKKTVEKEKPVTLTKTPESKIAKKVVPSTKDAKLLGKTASITEKEPKKSNTSNNSCQRIKRGQKEPCGKPSKKSIEINGEVKWFCGTEKTGCYAAEINQLAKKETEKEKIDSPSILVKNGGNTTSNGGKKQTNADKAVSSENKAKNLLHNILKVKSVEPHAVETKSNGKIYMIDHYRALCDPKDNEFYGVLDEDGDTILPIHDEARRFLEGNNCLIRQTVTNAKTKYQKRDTVPTTNVVTSTTKIIADATVSSKTSSSNSSESDSEETAYNTVINNVTINIEEDSDSDESSDDSDTD